jgi:multisubunit Na+/H+ antiporter MnhE subunit
VAGAALALAIMLVPAVLAIGSAQAQTFTTLHSFDHTDGAEA